MNNGQKRLHTGANTGIGFQIVRALYRSSKEPYQVLVGSRFLSNAHNAIEAVKAEFPTSKNSLTPIYIDIEDDTSVQATYNAISSQLIDNYGAQSQTSLASRKSAFERELWDKPWSVNTTSIQVGTSNPSHCSCRALIHGSSLIHPAELRSRAQIIPL
jgi:NAD(P)-dependent dehydrogenase (short-subunit alcohol dehydrogenase family)